ncbi:hypothetical protein VKT23_012831 [Stygiomarasmius scandens]|uniref:Uncharacterized protein n=1 Tax=Marasmiellus scandens TaxID=2682957 RepID=A0ABR1J8F3_9AGAR
MFTQWQLPAPAHLGDGPSQSEENRKRAMVAARTRKHRAKIIEKFGGYEVLKAMNKRHKQAYRERQRLMQAPGDQIELQSSESNAMIATPPFIAHPALIVNDDDTGITEREADLLSDVVGVEFPVDVTTIFWKGLGKRTVAPEVKIGNENYLKNDFENVSYLAGADEASSGNCNLTVLHDVSLEQLSKIQKQDIRRHLAQNQCLLIKGQRTREMIWDTERVCDQLKISPIMTVEAIGNLPKLYGQKQIVTPRLDAVKRESSLRASEETGLIKGEMSFMALETKRLIHPYNKELDQHVILTVQDMMENFHGYEQIRALLEIPVPQIESPVGSLSDEHIWAWSALNKFYPIKHQAVYADVHLQRMWALIHYGGFFTDVHLDADGLVTFAHFELGSKFWGLLRCKSATGKELRDDLVKKIVTLWDSDQCELENDVWNYQRQGDLKMIFGAPGDVFHRIMPPGQLHMVYTPQRSIAIGGHMLLYDCMHLTELARYIHARHGHTSNDDHSGMHRTLVRMMLALPFVVQDPNRVFYFRPLAAHCYMVMEPSEYDLEAQSSSKRKNAKRRRILERGGEAPTEVNDALKVCGIVLRILGFSSKDHLRHYMFNVHAEEAASAYSPGDEVNLRAYLPELLACVDTI